jgi:ABC-type protease/lipase transport system fused ATPase/permease subunit
VTPDEVAPTVTQALDTPHAAPGKAAGLHVADLRKEYPTPAEPLVVLRGVNVDLAPGEPLAVVGPSGSGNRQEHAAEHPRDPRPADRRHVPS